MLKIQGVTIINDETSYVDFAGNSALKVPSGTTAERPAGVLGQIRHNTSENQLEYYDGQLWKSSKRIFRATVSATAPVSPSAGKLWWDSSTATLKIYYVDSNSSQWVDASPTLGDDFLEDEFDPNNYTFTPSGIAPASQDSIAANTTFTLTASAYSNSANTLHASSDWQIATNSTFTSVVIESLSDTGNKTSYPVTGGIANLGTYYWRVRYRDETGSVSNFSTPIEFVILAPLPTLGDAYCGGFYIGTICAASTCYYVIVAPNASGCAQCTWKTTRTTTAGTTSCVDGYANTYGPLNNGTHPAGNWTATRTIGGFSDWYLPARDELNQLYVNAGSAPAGEGFAAVIYWSSTQYSANPACVQSFNSGACANTGKTASCTVRAVRREPI